MARSSKTTDDQRRQSERQRDGVEQAPPARLADERDADRGRRKQDADDEGVEGDDAEIAGPARTTSHGQRPLRRAQLPHRHADEHGGERDEADHPLVVKERLGHRNARLAHGNHLASSMELANASRAGCEMPRRTQANLGAGR